MTLVALSGCFEEKFTASGDAMLEFSLDTLRFDTVFTEVGSATRSFRVYNNNDLPVKISRIYTEAVPSFFRINVDGLNGPDVRDVEILNGDSIWVFVEVLVDPDDPVSVSPFVIEDFLVFELNGNRQDVLLEAWGQNANYIPGPGRNNTISLLSCDLGEETWDDPRPYVIYGTLLIDSCTVIWPEGARVYVHGGIANNQLGIYNDGVIFTLPKGRIRSLGTRDNPVIVQDDRLEQDYTGLWGGIRLGPASGPHTFDYTIVRNATTGIGIDSASRIFMEGVVSHNNSGSGLFARHARIEAFNCLFYDNAAAGVALTYGGDYEFEYTTIASFGNDGEGLVINNFYCADPNCQTGVFVNNTAVDMTNCIVAGSQRDEILLVDAAEEIPEIAFDIRMKNCIATVDELLDEGNYPDFFETICTDCVRYMTGDTLFVDIELADYHLDTLSIAEERAIPIPTIQFDLDGVMRDANVPDIGCYEFQ